MEPFNSGESLTCGSGLRHDRRHGDGLDDGGALLRSGG